MSTADQLEKILKKLAEEDEKGGGPKADAYEEQAVAMRKKLKKEENAPPPPHPALRFGPIAQTVAIMAVLSLGMGVAPLPWQMIPFYTLFCRITILAVVCLVSYTGIIYYGYSHALASAPNKKEVEDPETKLKLLLRKMYPDRPDAWAHTRSHPSAFLTTRHAPPRIFPFPLGKSTPDASVKDELWWEGGNAPHVGHFNKPKLPAPPAPDPEVLMKKAEAKMAIEAQQNLWKKRIRNIQIICILVMVGVVNRKVAAAGLAYVVYSTISAEIENMLSPGPDMEAINETIERLTMTAGKNESAPKANIKKQTFPGGMSYIFDQGSAGKLAHNGNIPIYAVPPPVLLTSQNHWYAGPGEVIKQA